MLRSRLGIRFKAFRLDSVGESKNSKDCLLRGRVADPAPKASRKVHHPIPILIERKAKLRLQPQLVRFLIIRSFESGLD